MTNKIKYFEKEREDRVKENSKNKKLNLFTKQWIKESLVRKYVYNFSWLGRPIIQYPQDIIAMQEIIWSVKPDMIIETGIAHGGSLIFNASMLALLEISGKIETGQVLGIDIDIRKHNKKAISAHPMNKKITMFEGSSLDKKIIDKVYDFAKKGKKILLCLDINHTHEHVLNELEVYAPLVSVGSYCIVFDTVIEDMPKGSYKDRPWDKGNNPKTAVKEYLKNNPEFVIDNDIQNKILITVSPGGFLRRITKI